MIRRQRPIYRGMPFSTFQYLAVRQELRIPTTSNFQTRTLQLRCAKAPGQERLRCSSGKALVMASYRVAFGLSLSDILTPWKEPEELRANPELVSHGCCNRYCPWDDFPGYGTASSARGRLRKYSHPQAV